MVENSQASKILEAGKLKLTEQSTALRGVADNQGVDHEAEGLRKTPELILDYRGVSW